MFMAIDQYGQSYHGLVKPRRDLLRRIGRKHASRMFRDKKDGQAVHVGWIIGGLWLTIYEVTPMELEA